MEEYSKQDPEFVERFTREWNEICDKLKKSGYDLSKIELVSRGK